MPEQHMECGRCGRPVTMVQGTEGAGQISFCTARDCHHREVNTGNDVWVPLEDPRITSDYRVGFQEGAESAGKVFAEAVASLPAEDGHRVMEILREQDAKRRRGRHIVTAVPADKDPATDREWLEQQVRPFGRLT